MNIHFGGYNNNVAFMKPEPDSHHAAAGPATVIPATADRGFSSNSNWDYPDYRASCAGRRLFIAGRFSAPAAQAAIWSRVPGGPTFPALYTQDRSCCGFSILHAALYTYENGARYQMFS